MKSKIIVLSVFIFILTSVFAQKNQNKRTFDDFKAQKIALISERTQLTPEEAQHFWPVYNELQQKKSELHKKNRQQNKDLSGLSEADFEKMNEDKIEMEIEKARFEKEYYLKFKQILPSQKIYQLYKAEKEFKRELLSSIQKRKKEK